MIWLWLFNGKYGLINLGLSKVGRDGPNWLEDGRWAIPALALGVAYAASDELHQHFVPGRTGAPLDVAIDAVGVALGVAAWRQLGKTGLTR